MQVQEFDQLLLEEQTITNYMVEGIILGYEFKIRYPFWRGTYLSCIEKLEVAIDREVLSQEDIFFTLNGKRFLMEELRAFYKEYWYVLEDATLTVIKKGGITKGFHEVAITLQHRIPYGRQPDGYRSVTNTITRTLMAE
ncbi:MAG TPA: hypothetical protein GXX75_18055 [Clostridiales bacterium]|nr:hypothetical protein [Clostridiales bacterium]